MKALSIPESVITLANELRALSIKHDVVIHAADGTWHIHVAPLSRDVQFETPPPEMVFPRR